MIQLPKKAGARFSNVATIKIDCNNRELLGIKTLKSAEEIDDFTHVIQSVLSKHKYPVIVKIHESGSYLAERELAALKHLSDYENCVQYLCDFECMDDPNRWIKYVEKPVEFCKNQKANLHFIVMEYIEHGDIFDYIKIADHKKDIRDMFLQVVLSIFTLGFKYRIYHGDLHSGNILIDKTSQAINSYVLGDKTYRIKTHGYVPKFVDFGRSGFYEGKIRPKYVIEDALLIISSMSNCLKDTRVKDRIRNFIRDDQKARTDAETFIIGLKKSFVMR